MTTPMPIDKTAALAGLLQPLTARQQSIVSFMWRFYLENDQLPNGEAIARQFGFRGRTGAVDHLKSLSRLGYIERNTVGAYRFTPMFHKEQRGSTEDLG